MVDQMHGTHPLTGHVPRRCKCQGRGCCSVDGKCGLCRTERSRSTGTAWTSLQGQAATHLVRARLVAPHPVVGIRVGGVEVEDKDQVACRHDNKRVCVCV